MGVEAIELRALSRAFGFMKGLGCVYIAIKTALCVVCGEYIFLSFRA